MRTRTGLLTAVFVTVVGGAMPMAYSAEVTPKEDAKAIEEIVVTGTRLHSDSSLTPTPTVSITAESLQHTGTTNLTDFLSNQPALVGSRGSTQTSGSNAGVGETGLNLLNLRNLGTDRTLVLVDGRRHVAQVPETAAVDINTIPEDLIERIDIATGGVSAVYGADAVSGVVNFIMKKDFQGLTARAQYGTGDGGKPVNWLSAITGGTNFADGRGNISGSFEYTSEGRLRSSDRKYLTGANYVRLSVNPDPGRIPNNVPINDIRYYNSSREGGIDMNFTGTPNLRPDGSPFIINKIEPSYSQGGTGTFVADYFGDQSAQNKHSVTSGFLNYAFSDRAKFFGELKYAHGNAFSESQPTFDYSIFIDARNPYVSPALAALIVPGTAAGALNDPNAPDGFYVNRDNFDLGVLAERIRRETARAVAGFNGAVTDNMNYELSYTYGESKVRNLEINNRYTDRYLAALDVITDPATGKPACRSTLDPTALPYQPGQAFSFAAYGPGQLSFTPGPHSGCLPLNILGEGVANPASIAWVMPSSVSTSKLTQSVFNGFLSGKLPRFALPGGALEYVLGVEWRRESSQTHPPLENQLGLGWGTVIFPSRGSFDVKEAFTELRLPVLKDKYFADTLQFNGALRVSNYSTVGTTTTWNVGTLWAPIHSVTFRGTLAQSVRAPNIGELFAPESQTFNGILDPCDINNLSNGTHYRSANCAAILSALGVDPTTFTDQSQGVTVGGLTSGNARLKVETAKSWTAGVVITPSFAPGLLVAIDAYDIKIADAINTADAQSIADNCVDQPSIDNVFCAALRRNSKGAFTFFSVKPLNVANFRTAGYDFKLNYLLNPARLGASAGLGQFKFAIGGGHLNRLTKIPTPGALVEDDRTTQYAPEWQGTLDLTWYRGPLTISYVFDYFSKTTRYSLNTLAGSPNWVAPQYKNYASRHTQDMQLAYDFDSRLNLYVGIQNLANQLPGLTGPLSLGSYPVSPDGRFLYAGVRANLGGR